MQREPSRRKLKIKLSSSSSTEMQLSRQSKTPRRSRPRSKRRKMTWRKSYRVTLVSRKVTKTKRLKRRRTLISSMPNWVKLSRRKMQTIETSSLIK